jgi:hypothetical protein
VARTRLARKEIRLERLWWAVIACAAGVVLFKAACWADGPPYEMRLGKSDEGTFAQFTQRGAGLVTPRIPVELEVDREWLVELSGSETPIPGVRIDFHDNAPSPGIVRMFVGRTKIELRETCYFVNNESRAWGGR